MSDISFEREVLTAILPWQKWCAACGDEFELGDKVYTIKMGNGKTRLTFDINCLEQFSGFLMVALLTADESEVTSKVN